VFKIPSLPFEKKLSFINVVLYSLQGNGTEKVCLALFSFHSIYSKCLPAFSSSNKIVNKSINTTNHYSKELIWTTVGNIAKKC